MANFVGVLDPDPVRREAFRRAAAERIAPLPGLVGGALALDRLSLVWAASARAPVSAHRGEGEAAVLWGDAMPGPGPARLDAAGLLRAWCAVPDQPPDAFDGYYAACAYTGRGGVRLGGDVLGMFPLYYWHHRDVVLFGSSAALFALHPLFRVALDPRGLAGILTLNGLVVNRTIYHGVQRLGAGRVLVVRSDGHPTEVPQYTIPDSTAYHDSAFATQLEMLDETLASVMARHAPPGEPIGLMLSGGLDSRMLAGLLHRQGTETVAMTLGIPRDIEARSAKRVARTLGFQHILCDDDAPDPVAMARVNARWEHLSGGFYGATGWAIADRLRALPARTVAGYALDFLMSPKNPGLRPGHDLAASFKQATERGRRWGLPPDEIEALLGRPGIVDEVMADLLTEFAARSPRIARARWKHLVANRGRFHLGGAAWRMSFGSWPVFPVLDRSLHAAVAGLPFSTIGERRVETELIRSRFPGLARLPLDRNSLDNTPIEPPTAYLVGQALSRRVRPVLRGLHRLRGAPELRYYYRTGDFNRPQWRLIRQEADRVRHAAAHLVDQAALDRCLPRADVRVEVKDAIIGANRYRLLIGLLLWADVQAGADVP